MLVFRLPKRPPPGPLLVLATFAAAVTFAGPAGSPVRAGVVVSVNDSYRDLLNDPVRTELDGIVREVAVTKIAKGRYAEAVDQLGPLLDRNPNDARLAFVLAVACLGDKRWEGALKAADRCVQIRPSWLAGYWLKGAVLVGQSRLDEAEKVFDQAVRIDPEHPGAHYQRGTFLVVYRAGDAARVKAGISELRTAQERNAPRELVEGMLGKAYLALKDQPTAERHLRLAVDQGGEALNLEPLADLASLYDASGRSEQADQLVATADRRRRAISPDRHDVHGGFFLIVARHGRARGAAYRDVLAAFDRVLLEQPENAAARLECARWLDAEGRGAEAVPRLREGLRNPPYDPDLAAQLAWALTESGQDLNEARGWLNHALRKNPDSPYLADTAAWIAFREGRYREALAAIRPSLILVDDVPEVAYHVGAIHAELGQGADAVRYLRKALRSGRPFPGDRRAKELLAKLDR